jgi:hypothetical protein
MMTFMRLHSLRPNLVTLLAVVLFIGLAAGSSHANSKQTYYFLVYDIKLGEGMPKEIEDLIRKQVIKSIAAHERLIEALPEDAPDPKGDPKTFIRYKTQKKLRPYRVNIEVKDYRHEVEDLPAPRKGKRLTVSIALHMFGEAIPERVMAFTGEGSATIKMDIGKQLRAPDSRAANHDAIELAVGDALTTSLVKLDAKDGKAKKQSPRKKK